MLIPMFSVPDPRTPPVRRNTKKCVQSEGMQGRAGGVHQQYTSILFYPVCARPNDPTQPGGLIAKSPRTLRAGLSNYEFELDSQTLRRASQTQGPAGKVGPQTLGAGLANSGPGGLANYPRKLCLRWALPHCFPIAFLSETISSVIRWPRGMGQPRGGGTHTEQS